MHLLSISAPPHFYMVYLVQFAIKERKQQRHVTLCRLSMQKYVQFLTDKGIHCEFLAAVLFFLFIYFFYKAHHHYLLSCIFAL